MAGLDATICDLAGNQLAVLWQYSDLEVTIPANDSRTATMTMSIYDAQAAFIQPLSTALKVVYQPIYYDPHADAPSVSRIIFFGVILKPSWDAEQATLTINAHDPSLKWKHHFHTLADEAVNTGYTIDGPGLRILAQSAEITTAQAGRGVKPTGIMLGGFDTTPHFSWNPPGPGSKWKKADRGSCVIDTINDLAQNIIGPDWELRPCDADHPPTTGDAGSGRTEVAWEPGWMCSLDTYYSQGTDKSGGVRFHCGFGRDNAENVVWAPDGDAVRDYMVVQGPGDDSSAANTGSAHVEAAWEEFGLYGGWESSRSAEADDATVKKEVLDAKAQAYCGAYGYPPDYFTITPRVEKKAVYGGSIEIDTPFIYGRDYLVGDVIGASVKKGWYRKDLKGRITQVRFTQADSTKAIKCEIDCVPLIDATISDGGDAA